MSRNTYDMYSIAHTARPETYMVSRLKKEKEEKK